MMMLISDGTIHRLLRDQRMSISPFDPSAVQPSSVDLTLSDMFLRMSAEQMPSLDPREAEQIPYRRIRAGRTTGEYFVLHPQEFVLASTAERLRLPGDIAARVEGKSSLGRMGLMVHSTAGFIDAGFEGTVTLELSSMAPVPIILRPGMAICQVSFTFLDLPAERPYGHPALNSKYQNQDGPVGSKYTDSLPIGDDSEVRI